MKLPHHLADTALSRLFLESSFALDVVTFSLPGGSTLYEAGEEADHIYFLRAGRLGAIRQDEGMDPHFLGVIRPGEPAGEMAMISGTVHSAKVVALRDSEILALPRAAFFKAAEDDAKIMVQLARLMIQRARQTASRASGGADSAGCLRAPASSRIQPLRQTVTALNQRRSEAFPWEGRRRVRG